MAFWWIYTVVSKDSSVTDQFVYVKWGSRSFSRFAIRLLDEEESALTQQLIFSGDYLKIHDYLIHVTNRETNNWDTLTFFYDHFVIYFLLKMSQYVFDKILINI